MEHSHSDLEARVARLEAVLKSTPAGTARGLQEHAWLLGLCALPLLFQGLGVPNHPYQLVLGALTVGIAYHQGWFLRPRKTVLWVAGIAVNIAVFTLLYKLFIGSGVRHPLAWVQIPTIASVPAEGRLLSFVPTLNLQWEPTFLANWSIDFTVLQTFLLLLTLFAALFHFHLIASLAVILLLMASVPAFAGFRWDWVFPALIATGLALYLQRPTRLENPPL